MICTFTTILKFSVVALAIGSTMAVPVRYDLSCGVRLYTNTSLNSRLSVEARAIANLEAREMQELQARGRNRNKGDMGLNNLFAEPEEPPATGSKLSEPEPERKFSEPEPERKQSTYVETSKTVTTKTKSGFGFSHIWKGVKNGFHWKRDNLEARGSFGTIVK